MKVFIGFLFAIVFFNTVLFAQDDEYQKWLKQQQQEFQDFQSKQDKEFLKYLEKQWVKKPVEQPKKLEEAPKPVQIPVAPKKEQAQERKQEVIPAKQVPVAPVPVEQPKLPEPTPTSAPAPEPKVEPQQKPVATPEVISASYNFFGETVSTTTTKEFTYSFPATLESKAIAQFWEQLSKNDDGQLLRSLLSKAKELELNDYGLALLVFQAAPKWCSTPSQKNLFTWYMLTKAGYSVKVGFNTNGVLLFVESNVMMYGRRYLNDRENNRKFYVFDFSGSQNVSESVSIYEGDFPGANRKFSPVLTKVPKFTEETKQRSVRLIVSGKPVEITIHSNVSTATFLKNYPQTDWVVYANAQPIATSAEKLLNQLRPLLAGKNESEQLNILLYFVQMATEYATDQEQFVFEKPLFVEESLFYEKSDCEDRSVLFAYLVRELLGKKIVLLDYPGHIATAVKVELPIPGDYIQFGSETYLICDPTYIGAEIGTAMPAFKSASPNIIKL